jgi:DNA invertase Pin-like site-specific DNA recombinase
VDSANPADPMAQLAVVLLALFAQMERTYTLERAAHARAVAMAKGRRVGRPRWSTRTSWTTPAGYGTRETIAIMAKTGITAGPRSTGATGTTPGIAHRRHRGRDGRAG